MYKKKIENMQRNIQQVNEIETPAEKDPGQCGKILQEWN